MKTTGNADRMSYAAREIARSDSMADRLGASYLSRSNGYTLAVFFSAADATEAFAKAKRLGMKARCLRTPKYGNASFEIR